MVSRTLAESVEMVRRVLARRRSGGRKYRQSDARGTLEGGQKPTWPGYGRSCEVLGTERSHTRRKGREEEVVRGNGSVNGLASVKLLTPRAQGARVLICAWVIIGKR